MSLQPDTRRNPACEKQNPTVSAVQANNHKRLEVFELFTFPAHDVVLKINRGLDTWTRGYSAIVAPRHLDISLTLPN